MFPFKFPKREGVPKADRKPLVISVIDKEERTEVYKVLATNQYSDEFMIF